MPITRRYGQSIIPQLAAAAGQAQGEMQGMELDQRIVQNVRNRQLAEQQNQLRATQLRNERERIRAQLRARSGSQPNRARVIYPNRTVAPGGSPLQQQVQQAAQQFRQRQEEQARTFTDSPYGAQGPESSATLQTGDGRSFTVEGEEIVTRQGGTVADRTPAARGPGSVPSRRSQSKLAALESIGAPTLLNERQLAAAQQMAQDDEIDLSEFRQWLSQSIRVAEAQRERAAAAEQQTTGGPASGAHPSQLWQAQYYNTEKRAKAATEEAEQLFQQANPPRPDMTEDEFRQWLNENVTDDDQSWAPFYLGSGGRHKETIIDNRLRLFRQFKQKVLDAANLEKQRRKLLGQSDEEQAGGGGDRYTRSNPATPQTQEDFNALPSGAVFQDPDSGELMRKP